MPRFCKLKSTHKCQQTASIHKCQNLANCCQFISGNTLQTVANSQVPIPFKPLPIHKYQYLANCSHFKSVNSLQTVANSQVPIHCKTVANSQLPKPFKPLPIHKCQYLANCCQFTSANTLQTVANSQVPNLANCCEFTIAKPELANCFNSQVPRLCKLISTHECPTKACKQLQFTNANTLQPIATSQVQNQSLQVPTTCKLP